MVKTLIVAISLAVLAVIVAANQPPADAAVAASIPYNQLRFNNVRLANGVRLHYAEQGPADGEAVIMLHGYSDSWWSFSRLLPLLGKDVHAFALDVRGHGDSDRPDTGYAMRDMAEDVIAFMNARNLERATIIGHSMGSFVAQHVAAAAPERVARLVLIGSATAPRNFNGMADLKREAYALSDPVSEEFIRAFQESTVHVPVPKDFMARVITESRKLPAYVWRGVADGLVATDAPTGLAERRIPTLLMFGELDLYAPLAEQTALIAQHGTALLRIYRKTSHTPHWERPDEVAADLAAFMRTEPAPVR